MVLNSLIEMHVHASTRYSVDLKHLIQLLLQEDPNKRIPLSCLLKVYQRLMLEDGELNMLGVPDSPKNQ